MLKERAELKACTLSRSLVAAYRFKHLRKLCFSIAARLEGGYFFSQTVRQIMYDYHGVRIGAYSYGECFIPGAFQSGVVVGRYVSIAPGVRVFLRNHPAERLSMHPFFYNSVLGYVDRDTIPTGKCIIEHDAWIGERAIITAGCHRIGLGAVVGAGSVVTKSVPDFAVVAGTPAKVIRYRFPEALQHRIRASCWWDMPIADLIKLLPDMIRPLQDGWEHPLLRPGGERD